MKKALSRILKFFAGHDRRAQNNLIPRGYCICGALKPEAASQQSSLKTKSGLRRS